MFAAQHPKRNARSYVYKKLNKRVFSEVAMCDVTNPLIGKLGAAYVFAPQKGADGEMVEQLDAGLAHFSRIVSKKTGFSGIDALPGAGAAGGFGAGVVALMGGTLSSGIETVLDIVEFDNKLRGTDIVFTGEGKIDTQSVRGKVISGVAKRAATQNVPVIGIVGDIDDGVEEIYHMGVKALFSINRLAVPFSIAKTRSKKDLAATTTDVMRLIAVSKNIR